MRPVEEERCGGRHGIVGVVGSSRVSLGEIIGVEAEGRAAEAAEPRLRAVERIEAAGGERVVEVGEVGILVEVNTFSRLAVRERGKANGLRGMRRIELVCTLCEGGGEARRPRVGSGGGKGARRRRGTLRLQGFWGLVNAGGGTDIVTG